MGGREGPREGREERTGLEKTPSPQRAATPLQVWSLGEGWGGDRHVTQGLTPSSPY